MADTLAIDFYYAAIVTRFTAEGTAAVNVFGWQTPAQHPEGNRIAWVPGDPAGKMGEMGAPRQPGRNPRPIATLHELFTVYIDAVDTAALDDEAAQYRAARNLYNAWFRALYLAAHGNFVVRSIDWNVGPVERRYGATIRAVVAVDSMVPDKPAELAPVDTQALIDLTLEDVTETETIP